MSRARLLLIRPNSSIEATPPPLGLMYVASYLREEEDGYDIKILDARIKNLSFDEIKKYIKDYYPQYIGITGLHVDSPQLHRIARLSKGINKDCKVIIGGPYPTGDYKRALKDTSIDFCVIGEGEVTFAGLMRALQHRLNLEEVKGVAFNRNGEVVYAGSQKLIEDLDVIPFPAWDLIELDEYFYGKRRSLENPVQTHKRAVSIFSSRGCPYGCIYCHHIFGKKFRARSPQNVILEIKHLIRVYNIKEIEFLDDTFNFDKERAKKICDLIVHENINLPICFSNGMQTDCMDEELIVKLKQAGTYRINYGIESAAPRIQKIMGKGLNLPHAKNIIEETVRRKILCGAFFMLGFPSETEEEVQKTIDFAVKSKLHTAVFAIATPFPGTKLFNLAEEKGLNADISFSTVGKVSVNMSAIQNERLENLRIIAYRKFYFNPLRWWRIFIRVPRKSSIFKNFLEVIKVAFFKKELYG